jgi:uncharacterized protein YggE
MEKVPCPDLDPMKPKLLRPLLLLTLIHAGDLYAASAPQAAEARTVTVGGRGEVLATPDEARLAMSVELTRPELKAAQDQANRAVRDYLASLRRLGLRDEDLSTAGLTVRAEYDYSGKEGRKFLGYHVSRGVEIVVRDLDKIGECLSLATAAGINQISDPRLESSHADELRRQALAKAAEDAQANARVLAQTLDARLGPVLRINAASESVIGPPQPRMMALAASAPAPAGNEEMGFSAGQIRYTATLTAEFELRSP